MSYYIQPHLSQYDFSQYTATNGCTWTAGANGIACVTHGRNRPTPDYLHSLLPKREETNPYTAGWSIPDLVRACSRYGVTVIDRSGKGWDDAVAQALAGHYNALQGRSSAFPNTTCSGEFNGGHCIGWNPLHKTADGERWWWIDDGICSDGRWERESVLKRFGQALNFGIQYGSFLTRVPQAIVTPTQPSAGGNPMIRYATVSNTSHVMHLAKGQTLYERPGGKAITRMSKAGAVAHVGLAGSINGKAWRQVIVGTGVPYDDKKVRRTGLYVPASAGEVSPR